MTNKRTDKQLTDNPDKKMTDSDDEDDLLRIDPNDDFELEISESAINQLLGIISTNATEVTPLGKTASPESDGDKEISPSSEKHATVSDDDNEVTLSSLKQSTSIDMGTHIASPSSETTLLDKDESLLGTDPYDTNQSYSDLSISESAISLLLGIEKTPDSIREIKQTNENHPIVANAIKQEAINISDTQHEEKEEIDELDIDIAEQSIEYILSLYIHSENVSEKLIVSADNIDETIPAMPVRREIRSCEESQSGKAKIEPSGKTIDLEKEHRQTIAESKADKSGIDIAETFEIQLKVESINSDQWKQVKSDDTSNIDKHKSQSENAVQTSTKLSGKEKVEIDFEEFKKVEESTAPIGEKYNTSSSTVFDQLYAQAKEENVEKRSEYNVSTPEMKSTEEKPTHRKRIELESSNIVFKKPRLIYINPAMVSRFTLMANCGGRLADDFEVQASSELTKSKSNVAKCTNEVNCVSKITKVQSDSIQRSPVANIINEPTKATYNSDFQSVTTAEVTINKEPVNEIHAPVKQTVTSVSKDVYLVPGKSLEISQTTCKQYNKQDRNVKPGRENNIDNTTESTSTKRRIICQNSDKSSKTEHVARAITEERQPNFLSACSSSLPVNTPDNTPTAVLSRRVFLSNEGKKSREMCQQNDSRKSHAIVFSNGQEITQQINAEHIMNTDTDLEHKTLQKTPIMPDRSQSRKTPDLRVHVEPGRKVVKITSSDAEKKRPKRKSSRNSANVSMPNIIGFV